ncbi:MAG TPA: choice-of-anchor U domain-containing protein [Desulfatiglandales bacterium]|nr:choice-of-anchor U domain-containing protein [Desulfatiglandales bacterium]
MMAWCHPFDRGQVIGTEHGKDFASWTVENLEVDNRSKHMEKGKVPKQESFLVFLCLSVLFWCLIGLLFSSLALAVDDSLCARVKLEIKQELTLERQAFDAHMRITNGFDHIGLEDVNVNVTFSDEEGDTVLASFDPNDPNALFFIGLDSLENIDNVDGTGSIQPASTADIHWLIIPAPGAANGVPQGTLYYVGATLSYTIGGEEHVTDVSPDYIFVKPMPELTLDYFLPTDVYGDDAFTSEIEPPIPFYLGVRVTNNGSGVAREMKINSAQPLIVDNKQGLLIGFVIEGCEVNGQAATPSLLADLGDIDPNTSAVARWVMTCSLSGQFVEFTADYSHSDELGGELTSLLDAVNTHFLVRDVLVDVTGRDSIRDFLAKDGESYKVYESETVDTEVTDESGASSLSGSGYSYTLSTPVTPGFIYVKLPDPHGGQKELKEVVRSDGKRIKPDNAWLTKERNENQEWEYFIHLFDANSRGSYTVSFEHGAGQNHAPVLEFIPDRTRVEGEQLSFIVSASDEDGTTPSLTALPRPALATFTDQGDGIGIFDWTPAVGQAGRYEVTFKASDGVLEDSQRVVLRVNPIDDTDGDGMLDAWELEHFGTLDRDGTGDFDGDGISDLDEFLNGTDPTEANEAPTIPVIETPEDRAEVVGLQPDLVVENSIDPNGDTVTYEFELYSDEEMTTLVASESDVPEGAGTTAWMVPGELDDNTWYVWRVRATDGVSFSLWAYGSFFVNTENDPPGDLQISSPGDTSEVDTETPLLEVTNSGDPDEDVLTYTFEVYAESTMSTVIASAFDIPQGEAGTTSWHVTTPLDNDTWYWRVVVTDEHGATEETPLASFMVNTANSAPEAPVIASPSSGSEVGILEVDLIVHNASDLDGDTLTYFFELDTVATFDSGAKQVSSEIVEDVDTTSWHVTGLDDNTSYFWRVKASDGFSESLWVRGNFFVNTENDLPTTPTIGNPGQGAWVDTPTPILELNPAKDQDHDALTYRFELYGDATLTSLLIRPESGTLQWTIPPALNDKTWYWWRAQAEDEHGGTSGWTGGSAFFVNDNGVDDPPTMTLIEPSAPMLTKESSLTITWDDNDPDSNATIALYYDTDSTGEDGTLIVDGLTEDPDGASDSYIWDMNAIEDGTYYVYATITDGTSSQTSYAQGAITIDRTPPRVSASPPGGVFGSAQSVTLSADEAGEIYYTTDGSEPTTSSVPYTSPLEIDETATVKVMAVDAVGNLSQSITEIYVIAEILIDLDGDGMLDAWEVAYFGDLSQDGSDDFDGDGLSDLNEYLNGTAPTREDTERDGMPDGWEVTYGLDPLGDDADQDLDHDGINNLDEYLAGSHPANGEPYAPVLSLPSDGAGGVSLTPELETGAFSDRDGDAHAATEWQISTDEANFSDHLVLDARCDTHLTSLTVPEFILNVDTTYYWQVRFHDDRGAVSPWPLVSSFTTIDASASDDSDQNGVPDEQEITDDTVDLDDDGTPDMDQTITANMKCANTVIGDGQVAVKQGANVTSVDSIRSIDPTTIAETLNKPDEMPLGLICFKLTVGNPGDVAEVTVYLSEPAASDAKWYKYDPVNGWQDYSAHALFSADMKSVTLQLKDGDYGDCDGIGNGIIVDPSGSGTLKALEPSPETGAEGGGGCFIGVTTF